MKEERTSDSIRKPAAAGAFYPGNAQMLKTAVERYIAAGKPAQGGKNIIGIMSPHAGYVYSGPATGEAFSAIKNMQFDTAVILGTGHRVAVRGAVLCGCGGFATPLGVVQIDAEIAENLKKQSSLITDQPSAHEQEHSIEVQLPFLQVVNPAAKIVPLLLNTDDMPALKEIGSAIARALRGKKALLIVSTDLSHYPPALTAKKADTSLMLALSIAMNYGDLGYFKLASRLLAARNEEGFDTACCGEAAVVAGAAAALELGADGFELIKYSNSSDLKGADAIRTVGYAAGAFIKGGAKNDFFVLPQKERKELLGMARRSIGQYLKTGSLSVPSLSDSPIFNAPAALFVTLHENGMLRGCLGSLEPIELLQDAVCRLAVSSAVEDPRFAALSLSELDKVKIEISILSPMRRVSGVGEVQEGRHGVVIKQGCRSGTYLPQVWEHFKTKKEFLESLCVEKSGLPAAALKDPKTEFYVYTAAAFEE